MKLRLRHNSVRLRLTQGEVARLASSGRVEESVPFGSAAFTYEIVADAGADRVRAELDGSRITVTVPAGDAADWAISDRVEIQGENAEGESPLRILIEKDFACLTPRGAEDVDAFPHPQACAPHTQ